MQVVKRAIADLVQDPANARKHGVRNKSSIRGSLGRFKQQKPIVISKDNVVIAGNGTLETARELGWTEIFCVVSPLSGSELTAYGIADNRASDLASWDDDILTQHLRALGDEGMDLNDLGFNVDDLEKLFKLEAPPVIEGSKELGEDSFSNFQHQCPKCGFEFDGEK